MTCVFVRVCVCLGGGGGCWSGGQRDTSLSQRARLSWLIAENLRKSPYFYTSFVQRIISTLTTHRNTHTHTHTNTCTHTHSDATCSEHTQEPSHIWNYSRLREVPTEQKGKRPCLRLRKNHTAFQLVRKPSQGAFEMQYLFDFYWH